MHDPTNFKCVLLECWVLKSCLGDLGSKSPTLRQKRRFSKFLLSICAFKFENDFETNDMAYTHPMQPKMCFVKFWGC